MKIIVLILTLILLLKRYLFKFLIKFQFLLKLLQIFRISFIIAALQFNFIYLFCHIFLGGFVQFTFLFFSVSYLEFYIIILLLILLMINEINKCIFISFKYFFYSIFSNLLMITFIKSFFIFPIKIHNVFFIYI